MTADDLVIQDLAAENAELRDRIAFLDGCRLMAKQGIEQLHTAQIEIERQRRQIAALRDELRCARGVAAW